MSTNVWDYVIIGAGVAGANAVTGIRELDREGSVALLGAEPDPPLYRPDLSKELWLEEGRELSGSRLLGEEAPATVRLDTEVSRIDPAAHTVTLADGGEIGYGRLLLATGATPRTLPIRSDRVVYYRTAEDFRRVREMARDEAHLVVVGGGYIGTEMAAALAQNHIRVTLVTEDDLVLTHMVPEGLARRVTGHFEQNGVELVTGTVQSGESVSDGVALHLDDGRTIEGTGVVVGVGVLPATGLAEEAGLTVHDGIVVDAGLRTSAEDVFAAGDVARYPDSLLGERRVEHVDNAESMGTLAGRVMAGADETYTHTPFFWSDLFDDGYEAIGELTTRLETVEDFGGEDHSAGVVYYLDGGRVRGVLLWNTWDSVPKAQRLIERTAAEPVTDPNSLKGTI